MTKNDKQPITTQTQIQTDKVEVRSAEAPPTWVWLRSGNLQVIITLAGVAITLFNLWIASKLSPVASNIETVATQAKAIENKVGELEGITSLYLPRYIATEQQVVSLREGVARLEASLIRMEAKIDRINN